MGGGNGQTIHLGFAGDLLVGRKVSRTVVAGQQPEEMWGDLRPRMLATDAMIANLEAPITTHLVKWHKLKSFYLRADPAVIPSLSAGNIRCVSLANNHILDFGDQGLLDTRRHLEAAGIAFAGAGANADEAKAPVIFTAGQARIGLISITDNIPAFRATDDRPGTNYWKIGTDSETMARLSGLIDGLRAAGADLIVLSTHWGINYRWWPPQGYRAFARQAIERGVDIVHGHSAHLFQAVEFHRRGLILYDTGDFIEDLIVPPGFRSDHSFLFLVDIADGRVARLRMVPARLTLAKVNTARGQEAEVIRRAMIKRCRGFAVDIREEDGDLVATAPGTADG
ncbi:CapA family protein [Bauldia litoralis]|uniref:Poly-gamma-glutamate synthesis protein (Capsule biosynthesis protein) n=1 Tax=Bauldia litoralis TaxID=665467 RepID=A0A1G6C6G7_9HYPH|nr:CapA family protein [Bauldia litoralis]SDB28500.1 poly-gamma-glutamate synthesis protein (capsule biosynthesis protein) [Bauldia litoralis]